MGEAPPALHTGLVVGGYGPRAIGALTTPRNLACIVGQLGNWRRLEAGEKYGLGNVFRGGVQRATQMIDFVAVPGSSSPALTPLLRAFGLYRFTLNVQMAPIEAIAWTTNHLRLLLLNSSGAEIIEILSMTGPSLAGMTQANSYQVREMTMSATALLGVYAESMLAIGTTSQSGLAIWEHAQRTNVIIEYLGYV